MKRAFLIFLAIAVLGACAVVSFSADNSSGRRVIAYYFHGSYRCFTCRDMETYAGDAIESNFRSQLDKGRLVFKAVNVDEAANKHFVEDYKLYTKSLVLSLVEDGKELKYKNCDKIWEYIRDKDRYISYVKDEISGFLGEL